jgi:hypothetical protein
MPTPPNFKLALGPLVFQSKSVPAHGQVTLYNEGAKPLDIAANTLHIGGTCGNLRISPDHFTLAAGTHKVITVTDSIPNADLAARFSGHVPGQGASRLAVPWPPGSLPESPLVRDRAPCTACLSTQPLVPGRPGGCSRSSSSGCWR